MTTHDESRVERYVEEPITLTRDEVLKTYGVRYIDPGEPRVVEANTDNLYWYQCFAGAHTIDLCAGDALWWLDVETMTAHVARGPLKVLSKAFAVMMRGYMPETMSATFKQRTTLPYVNGCSTKQIFPPNRPGDPTLQLLDIPPFTSEQAHHIHSTVRCVYVLSGSGRSVVGMNDKIVVEPLTPGKVCVLDPMCPHHFETDDEHCIVIPFHVWSTVPGAENNHPMFAGTFMMNHGS